MGDADLLKKAERVAGVFLTPATMAEVFPGFEWDEGDEPVFTDQGATGTVAWCGEDGKPAGTTRQDWNPIADDGDALRLLVKLPIEIEVIHPRDAHELGRTRANDKWVIHNGDPLAATRRAIVRAAAALADCDPTH